MSHSILRELLLAASLATSAAAACAADTTRSPGDCASVAAPQKRLECYDALYPVTQPESEARGAEEADPSPPARITIAREPQRATAHFEHVWGMKRTAPIPITSIVPHRPSYVVASGTSAINDNPHTPTRGSAFASPRELDPGELKFQLSFKTEVISPDTLRKAAEWMNVPAGFLAHSRIWAAYTQQSNWQILNAAASRPFRETDYEPEFIWTYDRASALGPAGNSSLLKLVNVGFVHHSNGRGGADSRSWNRTYVQGGWAFDTVPALRGVSVLARKWWRKSEDINDDDNPDIKRYYGRGDLVVRWEPNDSHRLSLLLRHNLRLSGRGFAQLDYSWAHHGEWLPLHFQATSGYGESLIDYNHKQTTFGIGVSIGRW